MTRYVLSWAARTSTRAGNVLNYDFCPWANHYVYWLKKPIGWLFGAVVAAVLLGIFVAPQAFAIAAALVGLIVVGTVWPYLAVRGVSGSIQWNRPRCNEGEEVEVELTITNRWPLPLWGLMIEAEAEATHDGRDANQPLALACIPPLSTSRFTWIAKPSQRGLYPSRPAFIATGFPLGICITRKELKYAGELLVWPRTISLKDLPQFGGASDCVVGSLRDQAGYEGDVIGVRPYREGDSLRSIHWAQTARRDTLIVCERQSKAKQSVLIHINVSPNTPTTSEQRFEDEWLIRIGASVCREFLSHHWGVTCQIGPQTVSAEPGNSGLHRVMDSLARFQWDSNPTTNLKEIRPMTSIQNMKRDIVIEVSRMEAIEESLRTALETRYAEKRRNSPLSQNLPNQSNWSNKKWIAIQRSSPTSMSNSRNANASWRLGQQLWMLIDIEQDIDQQIKQQWERVCHDSASAAG
jgi:uncharacterized protein (DUF58 family)